MTGIRQARIAEPELIQRSLDTGRDTGLDTKFDGTVSFLHSELYSSTRPRREHIRSPRRSTLRTTKNTTTNRETFTLPLRNDCLRRRRLTGRLHRLRRHRSRRTWLGRTAAEDGLKRIARLVNIGTPAGHAATIEMVAGINRLKQAQI